MSYDMYRYIFIGGLALSAVMLIATVILFFLLNVKAAVGDITGSSKRKAIENIRNKNVSSNFDKKTEGKLNKKNKTVYENQNEEFAETAKISLQDRYDNLVPETSLLNEEGAVLNYEEKSYPLLKSDVMKNINSNFYIETDITFVHSNEVVR